MQTRQEFIDTTVKSLKDKLEKEAIIKALIGVAVDALKPFIGKSINKRMATAIDKALYDANLANDDCKEFNKPRSIWRDPGNEWLDVSVLLYFQKHGIGYESSPTIYFGKRGETFTESHWLRVCKQYEVHAELCERISRVIEFSQTTIGELFDASERVKTAGNELDFLLESLGDASYTIRLCMRWVK